MHHRSFEQIQVNLRGDLHAILAFAVQVERPTVPDCEAPRNMGLA